MTSHIRSCLCSPCLLLMAVAVGCSSSDSTPKPPAASPPANEQASRRATSRINRQLRHRAQPLSEAAKAEGPRATTKPFKLGDLIEPFTPPPIAELDKTVEWINNPVQSGMEIMRKKQEALGPPPVSVEEALKLRNDSPENNAKILGTLSRLRRPTTRASTSKPRSCGTPPPISRARIRSFTAASPRENSAA